MILLSQVFLTKHYRNRRFGDPEFILDFEEIYVIDSKTRSITRAKVTVGIFQLYSFLLSQVHFFQLYSFLLCIIGILGLE